MHSESPTNILASFLVSSSHRRQSPSRGRIMPGHRPNDVGLSGHARAPPRAMVALRAQCALLPPPTSDGADVRSAAFGCRSGKDGKEAGSGIYGNAYLRKQLVIQTLGSLFFQKDRGERGRWLETRVWHVLSFA